MAGAGQRNNITPVLTVTAAPNARDPAPTTATSANHIWINFDRVIRISTAFICIDGLSRLSVPDRGVEPCSQWNRVVEENVPIFFARVGACGRSNWFNRSP